MKDENDAVTIDSFTAPVTLGHYRAITAPLLQVSGKRWNGTTTPDSIRDLWSTPQWLFDYLDNRYGPFDIDAAASAQSAKCAVFYDESADAFAQEPPVGSRVFINPPFSDLAPWIELASRWKKERKCQVTIIIPHDISTAWAASAIINATEIINVMGGPDDKGKFRSGRIAFVNALTGKEVRNNNKGTLICHFDPKGNCSRTLYLSRQMMMRG